MPPRTLLRAALALLAVCGPPAAPAAADPRAPVLVAPAPEDQGPAFQTGIRTLADLPRRYVEQEFFVSGHVDVFRYGTPPQLGQLLLRDDVATAYTTRILIRRPSDPRNFHGTLVLEWLNSTAGFDSAPAWDMSARFFALDGIAWVGVSVSPTAVNFLRNGCIFLFTPPCGTRYQVLSLPEAGEEYEMVSQIVTLLRSDRPENPLPPGFQVERVFHVGQSQQASDVTTYAREFHFEGNDGYFVQALVAPGRSLSTGSPVFPTGDPRGLPPTDLPVPLVRAQTETELTLFGLIPLGLRQVGQDTPTFRYYEMPAVAHNTVHEVVLLEVGGQPVRLGDLCALPPNSGADGPVFGSYLYDAMWRNLELQARTGALPPHGEPVVVENGAIARDGFGNARGGVRLPELDVPVASYGPINQGKPACGAPGAPAPPDCLPAGIPPIIGLACLLSGSVEPFDADTLAGLYRARADYALRFLRASEQLRAQGFLLRSDEITLVRHAVTSFPAP
jgi:hypothetical protein